MLAANSELSIPPESHFIGYLYRRFAHKFDRWTPRLTRRLTMDIVSDAHFRDWGMDPNATAAAVLADEPATFAATIERFYLLYAEQEGKHRWGDKTPHYLFAYRELRQLFPDLLLVNVVRDGRDVLCSHLALRRDGARWTADSVPLAAAWWRQSIRAAERAALELGPRYADVRYEELVTEPEATLARLCAFVGIVYEPAMLRYETHVRFSDSAMYRSFFVRAQGGLQSHARNWRAELSRRQIAEFEAVAGADLEKLGYGLSGVACARATRAQARARAAVAWQRRSRGIDLRHAAHRYAAPAMRIRQKRRLRRSPVAEPTPQS
jgi:hypothetical protein